MLEPEGWTDSSPEAHVDAEPYVDAETAAAWLHLPVPLIYQMINSGELPALKCPVRIHPDDLDTVVERCRNKPGQLRHLNQYAGRPDSGVAAWFRSKHHGGGHPSTGDAGPPAPPVT